MIWWRVELDRDGSIKSAEQVEYAAQSSKFVRFVEADTKTSACSSAKQWYAGKLERARVSVAKRRKEARDAGLCWVCKKRPPTSADTAWPRCKICNDKQAESRRRRRSGAEPLRNLGQTPDQQYARERARGRTVDLRTALKQFDALSPEAFRAWLVAEIEKRSA